MRRLKSQRPNISPMQELMGETFGKVGDFWEKIKKINIKFFISYLLFLYVLPQFLSWQSSTGSSGTMLTGIVKSCSLLLIGLLPLQHFMPTEELYKKSSDPGYSYLEQFFSFISHSVFHMFVMEVFVGNHLLTLLAGIFWCAWSHYRLQGSRRKKLSTEDGNIYWFTWGICVMELVLVIREIIHWCYVGRGDGTGGGPVIDTMIDGGAMITYAVGIILVFGSSTQQKKLVWSHMQPFVIIISMHLLIQVLITCSSGVEALLLHLNEGRKGKLLPSGMLVMIFINSLFRDLKLKNEDAQRQQKHQPNSSFAASTVNSVIIAGMIVGSLVFYYSRQNIWYLGLQYCIVIWNLADIVQFANESKSGAANMMRRINALNS